MPSRACEYTRTHERMQSVGEQVVLVQILDLDVLTEQEFDEDKGTDRRFRTGNRQTMEGRMFIRHISTTLKCEIRATMREAGLDRRMPAKSAINCANAISGICSDGVCSIRNVIKNARSIYELFGFDLPTTIECGVMMCDVEKL